MAQEQDPRVAAFLRETLPRLRQRFDPLRAVIFGSRARGDALSTSDLDVILVSPHFPAPQPTVTPSWRATRTMPYSSRLASNSSGV